MVKGKNIRFIGNVLPATGHKPEGDSTFDFNSDESRMMDLVGVPLRIEHQGSLPIGKVTKSWDGKHGSKWILGEIEGEKGFASLYANHAIKPDSNGHTLYKGLSLQHVHQAWADGTTNKRPVEISICGEPRRPDCYIRAVSQTGKNEYIEHKASVNQSMSTSESAPQVTQETTESTSVQDAVGTSQAPDIAGKIDAKLSTLVGGDAQAQPTAEENAARNVANSQEELMKMFLAQDGKNNELMKQLSEMKKAKEEMEAKWKEREANEQIQTQSKAEALSKALVEQWTHQLGPGDMTEENKKAIFALAHEHPQASMQMMEIAHKASMKHAGTRSALIESEAMSKKRVLEQQVVDTIMKRRRTEPSEDTAHQASTKVIKETIKQKPAFNPFVSQRTAGAVEDTFGEKNAFLFNALKGASSGSARSVMDSIAKYRNGSI